jgi:hypothetical protein
MSEVEIARSSAYIVKLNGGGVKIVRRTDWFKRTFYGCDVAQLLNDIAYAGDDVLDTPETYLDKVLSEWFGNIPVFVLPVFDMSLFNLSPAVSPNQGLKGCDVFRPMWNVEDRYHDDNPAGHEE